MAGNKFTVKKEISIPHIMTFLTMLGGLCLWYSGLESRIAIAETKIIGIEYSVNRLEGYLIRIEDKVDRIKTKHGD